MATTVSLKPNAVEISGSTSGTTTLQATAVAGTTTLTLPAATDTLVGKATTDTLTNKTLTGAAMNGTLGATTPSTASVTTLTTSSTITHNGGTANGVAYLNGSKVLTTGSALVFDGSNLGVSGNLLVGTTSAPTGGAVSTWQNAGSSRWSMGPNGGTAFVVFNTSNVGCYVVDGQTGWTGTSDGTLKNVIAPITNGLTSIIGLKPTIYSWKSDEANTPYAGLIAQEVQSVLPDLVNDNNGTLGVNYTGVIPYLISAIQEQQALITTLTARITALKGS